MAYKKNAPLNYPS